MTNPTTPVAAELKACPFCGGEANGYGYTRYNRPLTDTRWEDGSEITQAFFVNCVKCGISNGRPGLVGGYQTRAEAITAWNTRTLTSLPSEREQIVAWQPIETAPKDGTAFQAKIPGHGADNVIAWTDGLLDANEKFCGTWAFVTEQEPPDCWTDGCCWAVNEDGVPSVQPTEWKPLPAPPRAHLPTTEQEEG